jgi:Holliday junction DNA helicase RuvA
MFAYLKGIIEEITEDNLVIDVNNVGYNVRISSGTAQLLPPKGEEIKIYTYTLVREDMFCLYGFLTRDDLEIFRKLITVSGIGPKGGLSILSVMDSDSLRYAIISGDAKAISKAPGIGARSAERIILELRDKIEMPGLGAAGAADAESRAADSVRQETAEALASLGYSASDALRAINRIPGAENMDTEELLRAALKNM